MSWICQDDRRSVRYTGSSKVTCDLAPVRPTTRLSGQPFTAPVTSTGCPKYLARRPTVVIKLTASQARFPAKLASAGIRFGRTHGW